uniref:Uncharacterized protein n=1 Tax=Candidatus Kentrum sp. TUN TaxID=2126343 RepID=A0A451A648_9GAMM|nr:MAG: hypothetical protein BECKTUN1418D_GA0071000_115313 [Candidatus Kentron sp. TUN]
MKNSKTIPDDLIAPTIGQKESRQRMRKLERALNAASEAVQIAKEEYHYLIYGTEYGSHKENRRCHTPDMR